MAPNVGDTVRLVQSASGMAAGSEGTLRGWFIRDEPEAVVDFWDGGPLRVPADAIEEVEGE